MYSKTAFDILAVFDKQYLKKNITVTIKVNNLEKCKVQNCEKVNKLNCATSLSEKKVCLKYREDGNTK